MNVVLYLRYSSERQTEQSIEGQQRVCREYCERNNYTIVGQYVDRATSASKNTDKRVEFLRMIDDASKSLFNGVVVYKIDRFSRDRYDMAIYKRKLKQNGVQLISAMENINDGSPENIILEAMLEGFAEYYSAELSQKVTRGMKESALKGKSCGGHIPFGYKTVNKQYVIDEIEAAAVREAFQRFAAGDRITEIYKDFNARGITYRGSQFNKNSFHRMFTNVKYIGNYKYGDIIIEGAVPAIIDKELFEAVQAKLKQAKSAPKSSKAKVNYLLSGKLYCGHCGGRMVGDGTTRRGVQYSYYACQNRKERTANKCDKRTVKKEIIERAVCEDVINVLTPEYIDALAEAVIKQNEKDAGNKPIDALQRQIEALSAKIDNAYDLMIETKDKRIYERINPMKEQLATLEEQLNELQMSSSLPKLEKDHVVFFLSSLASGDIEDEAYCRKLVDILVNSVTIYDEPDGYKLLIALNTTGKDKHEIVLDSGSFGSPSKPHPKFTAKDQLIWLSTKHRT